MSFQNNVSQQRPMSYSHLHGTAHPSRVSKHSNYTVFRHRGQYAATNKVTSENKPSANLGRFWRECRERDIRKQQNMYNQLKHYQKDDFSNIVNQLKKDAKQLNDVMNKSKISHKSTPTQHMSRTHRRASDVYVPPSQRAYAQQKVAAAATVKPNAHKNAATPRSSLLHEHRPELEPEREQSENCQIFFETRKYYAALHDKYDLNARRSSVQSMYDYFDSLKTDKRTLKKMLEQKWQELKQDVDKTVNYFNQKKNIQNCKKSDHNYADSRVHARDTKRVKQDICDCSRSAQKRQTTSPAPAPKNKKTESETLVAESVSIDTQNTTAAADDMKSEPTIKNNVRHATSNSEYDQWTVRELKEKLLSMNICIDTCIEKKDLIERLTSTSCNTKPKICSRQQLTQNAAVRTNASKLSQPQNAAIKAKKPSILYDSVLSDSEESERQIRHRVDEWIHRWSYRRSFRQILNSILGYTSEHLQYISRRDQDYTSVMKQYKKALLLIHPDKHLNRTFEIQYKSSEMFKVLKESCDRYKRKYAPTCSNV
eukprot:CAMPEP_0202695956 /NCGR_PEP_ID=MMETSP1385-20130828/9377_1 /ASSEMBLY_ACC=CAM_ASM_000861 /TAXON_ID=933848 /ORGANISM="Elphidium margaritaceum" /LENGTH=539 /DNA_ID=CAMNT_0049352045 /DNA_START=28 /DNA_END=1647 /DNA_ORIENTATION=+